MLLTRSRRTLAALAVAATLATGFFERTLALFTEWPQHLLSLWEATGSGLDPDGATTSSDRGSSLDPDGATTNDDRGSSLDPNGAAANGDSGSSLDPDGRT
jgi:hypothetical protein